jgi:8-oxo-dGTP diphosphatase
MFDDDMKSVLMIKKNRPEWQKGLLNGIGGKMEHGEIPIETMIREFQEECGIKTFESDWLSVLDLRFKEAIIYFFAGKNSQIYHSAISLTDEMVVRCDVGNILNGSIARTIENIASLITLSKQRLLQG